MLSGVEACISNKKHPSSLPLTPLGMTHNIISGDALVKNYLLGANSLFLFNRKKIKTLKAGNIDFGGL